LQAFRACENEAIVRMAGWLVKELERQHRIFSYTKKFRTHPGAAREVDALRRQLCQPIFGESSLRRAARLYLRGDLLCSPPNLLGKRR
jgi:hypothetical protein